VLWIESGFAFDLRAVFEDRWDDFERMVAAKPAVKSRDSKSAIRERSAAFFPLRPAPATKLRSASARKEKPKADTSRKPRSAKSSEKGKPRKAARGRIAAKAAAKRPVTRSK